MRQLSLPCDDAAGWPALLHALDDAVTYLGLKEVCYRLDVAKSTICDALHDRNDRRWAHEWTCVVLEMLAERRSEICRELARAILAPQAALAGGMAVVDDDGPTDEEIAAAERVLEAAKKRKARRR
jgi:hypothetical protein